jgi:Family of unknown function (DUF6152)
MRNNSSIKNLGWLLVLGLCTSTAWAHHGGGTFDANKCFVFKGAIRQVAWANPHAWLYVQVEKPAGGSELWGFEFGTVPGLSRAGFRPSDFAIGTKITVTAYANREIEKHTGSAHRLILPDGRDVSGSGIAGTAPAGGPPGAAGPPGAGGPPGPGAPGRGGPLDSGGPAPSGGPLSTNCPDYS